MSTDTLTVSDDVIDQAAAAVLAEKFEYEPQHLENLKRRQARIWKRTRREVETILASALASGTLDVYDVTTVEVARAGNTNIEEFRGEHRFLSNFWPLDKAASIKDYTAEHWYQVEKTTVMAERDAIRACKTPGEAKELSQSITLREDWDDIKLDVMRKVLKNKFDIPWLRFQLLATGSAMLIEGNDWCDTFWGVCHCPKHGGSGANWLGLLLMERRNELRAATRTTN